MDQVERSICVQLASRIPLRLSKVAAINNHGLLLAGNGRHPGRTWLGRWDSHINTFCADGGIEQMYSLLVWPALDQGYQSDPFFF